MSSPRPRDELLDGPPSSSQPPQQRTRQPRGGLALAASSSSASSSSSGGTGSTYYTARLSSPPPSNAARGGIRGFRGGSAANVAALAASSSSPSSLGAAAATASATPGIPTPPSSSPAQGRVRTMAAGYAVLPPEAQDSSPVARATSRAALLAAGAGATVGLRRSPEQRLSSGEPLFFATPDSLTYLDGSLPGDFGFDPLGFFDPSVSDQRWLATAEVMNGRWAMVGVVLAILEDVVPHVKGGRSWFERLPKLEGVLGGDEEEARALAELALSGANGASELLGGNGPEPWTTPAGAALSLLLAAFVGAAETARAADLWRPGSVEVALGPLLPPSLRGAFEGAPPELSNVPGGYAARAYPGGPVFNCLNVVESPRALASLEVAEIKHGRLAMVAALAFIAQAAVTGDGPLVNLEDHLRAPFTENVLTQVTRVQEAASESRLID
jgi:light-harvesting complex I chlorophyll a/b binding protein 3